MQDETTRLLARVAQGNRADAEALMPLVYEELRAMAGRKMQGERPGHTLQPTALVNEVYLKMIDQTRVDWRDRSHFCAVAATLMRRILIDYARQRAAGRRGGGAPQLRIDEGLEFSQGSDPFELIALDDLLHELAQLNARHARVVELRVFAGLSVSETAEALDVSPATVKYDWRVARAWLMSQYEAENPS
jgi:RNA polymerase sigma factor (TIGR02999 family)